MMLMLFAELRIGVCSKQNDLKFRFILKWAENDTLEKYTLWSGKRRLSVSSHAARA
jgi:hypothetical protein